MSSVRRIEQISVFLENRSGQMALLCSSLADAGVNVLAVSVADTVEHGLVRIVVDNPDQVCSVITTNGFNCLRAEVLAVELPNRKGSLAEFSESLGAAGVNIQYLYGSLLPTNEKGLLIVRVLDLDVAEKALENWTA
ncbi:MAG: amino acid-binding protein [Armatimonadetes bacterium]|nr:amino acid-binding protein [Armatimonadota bacterium]